MHNKEIVCTSKANQTQLHNEKGPLNPRITASINVLISLFNYTEILINWSDSQLKQRKDLYTQTS